MVGLPVIQNIAPGASVHLSTSSLPERDRLGIWLELYGHKLFNLEIDPIGKDPFRAEVTLRSLPADRLIPGRDRNVTSARNGSLPKGSISRLNSL